MTQISDPRPVHTALVHTGHVHGTRCWWNPDEARWVCRAATAAATSATPNTPATDSPLVDVRDMVVVHTAMLREFRLAPAAVMRVEPGDGRTAAVVDRHLAFLCDLLHHHHRGEDELLWPLLRDRVPSTAMRLLDEMDSQHAGLDGCLHAVEAARQAWVAEPTSSRRELVATELGQLHELLRAHLDMEESAVLPLAASVLTVAEWQAIGEAGAGALSKPDLMLAFGMFAYEGDPAVLRTMLSSAPAVPRILVPRIGPRVYARRARAVHGTARP